MRRGQETRYQTLICLASLSASCAVGANSKIPFESGGDGAAAGDNNKDPDYGGDCEGAGGNEDCSCWVDSDGDNTADCEDECPFSADGVTSQTWYADCDGDGQPSYAGIPSCYGEPFEVVCADGEAPDGGWLLWAGSDCQDENAEMVEGLAFYPDCDLDGEPSATAIQACSEEDASAFFDCEDGDDPAGGFSPTPGTDCDDEDPAAHEQERWFADCDGDAVGSSEPIVACDLQEVNATFRCADGEAPKGGFLAEPGSDCNDEDPNTAVATEWFADCDGDGVPSMTSVSACGSPGDENTTCLDGGAPDGGYATTAGTDCNDELKTNPCPCGEQDDDGDKVCKPIPPPRSCLEILNRNPAAVDGTYAIDPDNNASTPELSVVCDMSGGGFTQIALDVFATSDPLSWHAANGNPSPVDTNSTCAQAFGPMLGGTNIFGVGSVTEKTFKLRGIPHTEVSVRLNYLSFDSWDNEYGIVLVDGVEKYRQAFDYQTATANRCGAGWRDVGLQPVDLTVGHTANTVTIRVSSTLDSAATNESFGVNRIVIRIR